MIPYGKQEILQNDIDQVIEVLKSDFLTQGPQVTKFENAVSNYCQAKFAIAVNSATSALHLACMSLNLNKGDYLWTSPITFVASANCALYCGAEVDFVDINPKTFNMCPLALEKKLIEAEKLSKLPKIVIPVHMCGQPCNMKAIFELSKRYGFKIIEDASHAIGASYLNNKIGSCEYSDITVFSFHPVKIITTGEGGVAVTNHSELSERIKLLSSHGITRDAKKMTHESEGQWYYQQIALGYNYRITDIQAALGSSQIKRLDHYVKIRHKLAKRYDELLENFPLSTPYQDKDAYSSFHLYVIRLKDDSKRTKVFDHLRKNNIGVNIHYIPVHTQPFFRKENKKFKNLTNAENYYEDAISLPLYPSMTNDQQDKVVSVLEEALNI